MAKPEPPGTEISVNHYDFITLFLAYKVPKGEEESEQNRWAGALDKLCRSFSAEMIEFNPCIGQIVGVYLPNHGPNGKWVRGRVEECIQQSTGWQYRILLIDWGQYVRSQRRHLVQLNQLLIRYPPLAKRIGLYGVLPQASLNQNTRLFLTDLFHKGQIYFKKKLKIQNMLFGDISVQDHHGEVLSLTKHLLANNFVKEVDNFEEEAKKIYRDVKDIANSYDALGSLPPPQITKVEVKETISHPPKDLVQKFEKSKDTGYSSSDDYNSDGPFVREDAIFVPAGFNYNNSLTKKKKGLKSNEVKPIKTYFQIMNERKKSGEKQSSKRPKENTQPNRGKELNNRSRETIETKLEESIGTLEVDFDTYKPRKVGFFEIKPQETEVKGCEKKRRTFNLNYKKNTKCPEKDVYQGDAKTKTKSYDNEVSMEINQKAVEIKCEVTRHSDVVEFKEETREILELSHNSLNCSGNLSNLSAVSCRNATNESKVSNDIDIPTTSLDNSILSKKQRVSKKLKAGLAVREIIERYGEGNVKEDHTKESIKGDFSRTDQTFERRTLTSYQSDLNISSINESIDDQYASICHLVDNSKITSKRLVTLTGQKSKQVDQADALYSDKVECCSVPSSTVQGCEEFITEEKKLNTYVTTKLTEDSGDSNKFYINSNISLDSEVGKCLSLQEKRKRIKERLRKKKEINETSDSDISKSDLSTSWIQSVGSDDSNSNLTKPSEKPTLASIITVPIEELEKQEDNFDYVDVAETQTFLRGIISNTGVLIHTKDDKLIRPAISLTDCYLDGNIIQALEGRGKREMNRIQKFAYPTILARRNIVMVSPRRSGKTCGYVIPIASNLLSEEFYTKLPSNNGPRALVVTPCWESGDFAASEFKYISPLNTVIHCYGGGAEIELKVDLLKGTDVLVTTPRCLLRLLDMGLTNLSRLCHLVLDDADVLFEKFRLELQKLMVAIDSVEAERERCKVEIQLQVVLATRTWTPPVEELVTRILAYPTICIASQLEACVYAGIKPKAIFVENDKKIEKLVDILKEIEGKQKIVVMCKCKDDVKMVFHLLIDLGVKNVIAAHEDLSSVGISEVPGFWHKKQNIPEKLWNESSSLPIMIRSDEVLEEVPITNATMLIHYNMSNSKKTFSLRFISLMENYNNVLKQEAPKQKPQVVILLDEKNDLEVPGVMEFMKRLGTILPEPILKTLEKIEEINEEKRMSEPLCESVKEFGQCWDVKSCPARHLVSLELDFPHDVPRTGWVKIMVQYVHDACHFSVRLIEHAEKKEDWKRLPSNLLVLSMKLNNFYAVESNKRLHGYAKVGDIVALETSRGVYQRAIVLKIIEFNKYNKPVRAFVQLLDNGRYDQALVSLMWYLPEELALHPPSVVDVYLCGLRPKDLDVSWPPAPRLWVEQQLKNLRCDSPNGYMLGKIKFALKGCLWLEPVEYLEFLPKMETTVFLLNLRKDLLETNNATENNAHIPALHRLCERAGIEIPTEEKPKYKKPFQPKPLWAWLPQDCCESVHIIVVQDPSAIFLRLTYFEDCLEKLVLEIQKYASTQKKERDCKNMFDVGDVCLGKPLASEEWNRAVIKSFPDKDKVELFFVDYGDTEVLSWKQVMPIANKFITQLPFQVIECYLAGVKFIMPESDNTEWENDIVDMIYNLSRNDMEEALLLKVKVCSVEENARYTNGRRYKVVLENSNVNPVVYINSSLCSSNFAELVEKEDLIEAFKIPKNTNEENSDIEKVIELHSKFEVVPVTPDCDISYEGFNEEETQFLRNIVENDIDYHCIDVENDDADVSENMSGGSVMSLPRQVGYIPQANESLSNSSSLNSSSLSLYQDKSQSDIVIKGHNHSNVQAQCFNPVAISSPNSSVCEHNTHVSLTSFSPTSLKKITGVASTFIDLISPNLLDSSQSPQSIRSTFKKNNSFTKCESDNHCYNDIDNDELDSSIYEINVNTMSSIINPNRETDCPTSNINVDKSGNIHLNCIDSNIDMKKSNADLTDSTYQSGGHLDLVNHIVEAAEVNKSPCQKWVECVIPESEEDLSLMSENSLVNEIENAGVRTPLVEWYQDDCFVILHIKLPSLTEYEFRSDVTSIYFSAIYSGMPYKVDLPQLFGGHKPEKARGIAQACFFEIRLEKLLKGRRKWWPRLTKEEGKIHWLKLNAEKACEGLSEDGDDDDDVKRLACTLPLWNENPTDSNSVATSDKSELAISELSL